MCLLEDAVEGCSSYNEAIALVNKQNGGCAQAADLALNILHKP
jgi:hypothetical protein